MYLCLPTLHPFCHGGWGYWVTCKSRGWGKCQIAHWRHACVCDTEEQEVCAGATDPQPTSSPARWGDVGVMWHGQGPDFTSARDGDTILLLWMLRHSSHVRLLVTSWTIACQVPLSMGFSRQEYWSGLPFPSPRTWTTQGQSKSVSSGPGGLQDRYLLYASSRNKPVMPTESSETWQGLLQSS